MRVAILSDIHGNLVALDAVLHALAADAPDLTVNLGDCVTSPLWPRETCERLETLALPTVRGNHDRWLTDWSLMEMSRSMRFTRDCLSDRQIQALHALPASLRFDGDVLAVHGTPASDADYLLEQAIDGRLALAPRSVLAARVAGVTASLILCGHSHYQHVVQGPDGVLVVNPGSVGFPRYADNDDPTVAEAGSPHARYAIATRRNGRWSVELRVVDYDWSLVTQRAREVGRDDFARAFVL